MNEIYPINFSTKITTPDSWVIPRAPAIKEENMLKSGYINEKTVKELWRQKIRLDEYFEKNNLEKLYYRARNTVFPQDKSGSVRFRNRAGDKLFEIHESVGLFPLNGGVFFDIAGGPGAWSEVLLGGGNWVGYGMTLQTADTPKSVMWYKSLNNDKRWKALWGSDNTGNIYNIDNINNAVNIIKTNHPEGVTLAMADGGFHIPKMEHLQELHSFRIVLSELVTAVKSLKVGGYWVSKLFDTFSHLTASLVYITGVLFEKTYIVKPKRSRVVNSERYIVGHRFKGGNKLINYLTKIYTEWNDNSAPVSLVPIDLMRSDKKFMESFSAQVKELAEKQIKGLDTVMNLADSYHR